MRSNDDQQTSLLEEEMIIPTKMTTLFGRNDFARCSLKFFFSLDADSVSIANHDAFRPWSRVSSDDSLLCSKMKDTGDAAGFR
jgi:hypothetical protein